MYTSTSSDMGSTSKTSAALSDLSSVQNKKVMRKFCFHLDTAKEDKFDFHQGSCTSLDDKCEHHLIELFLEACRRGDLYKVEAFLEAGVDVNSVTDYGEGFALMYAVQKKNLELLDLLLSQDNVDVNMVSNPSNITALMMACHEDSHDIVKKLIGKKDTYLNPEDSFYSGIDFNCMDIYGNTAAMVAVLAGSVDCLKLLSTEKEVNWNKGDKEQNDSVAILAVREENIEIIEILAQIGSLNWNWKNIKGKTAFSVALENGNEEVVMSILSNVSKLDVDVELLKSQNVYQKAVEACEKYVHETVNDISRSNDSLMFVLREGLLKMLNSNIQDGSSSKKRLRLVYEEDCQCPVCFAVFSKEAKVFHCSQGHFTCGSCRLRLNRCPECRANFIGRAIGFERTLC